MSRRERWAWVALLASSLVVRLWVLGDRPPHHDEAVHAHFTALVANPGIYRYDPTYHGPLLFYVTAVLFGIGGENLITLRLYPVATGMGLIALPLLLRRRLGPRPALWTAALAACSPVFLYYSRFARNDVPVCLFTAAALVCVWLVRRKGWKLLPWAGVAAALHLISKETFYVTLPLLAVATGGVMLRHGLIAGRDEPGPAEDLRAGGVVARSWWLIAHAPAAGRAVLRRSMITSWNGLGWWWRRYHRGALAGALWFVAITLAGYTFFFTNPGDAFFPYTAVTYWWEQHSIQRIPGPWFFHLTRMSLYEFLPLLAALIWVGRRWRRLRDWEVFCLFWALSSFVMFAYLGEKVPWLLVHQVLPLLPLAGAQMARTFSPRGAFWSRGLAVVALLATVWSAWNVTFRTPTLTPGQDRAELLVFVQTTPALGELARRGLRLHRERPGQIVAAVSGEASWPLSWQWRRIPVVWGLPSEGVAPPLVVCDPHLADQVQDRLTPGYLRRSIPLRGWWVEEWKGVTPRTLARWFVTRRPWSPLGATETVVLEREEELADEGVNP